MFHNVTEKHAGNVSKLFPSASKILVAMIPLSRCKDVMITRCII